MNEAQVKESTPSITVIVEHYRQTGWTVIEILQEIQRQYRYLSAESLQEVSRLTDVPLSRLYSIATFYKSFSLKPLGRHHICVCQGTACHVAGSQRVMERFEQLLGVRVGETSADGEFSLATVRCVGACSLAPVVVVGEEAFGRIGANEAKTVIEKYRWNETADA